MVRRLLLFLYVQSFIYLATPVYAQDNYIETKDLSMGNNHTCALTEVGVKCWGDAESPTLKAPLETASNPRSIVVGNRFSCMIVDEGIRCWGDIPEINKKDILIEHKDLNLPKLLSAGHNHACAVSVDDQIKCWGENLFGETQPPFGLKNISELSLGLNNSCAIADGKVVCWGMENTGSTTVPEDLKNPRNLTSGWWHHCVSTDEGIRCWGNPYKNYVVPDEVKMATQFASGDFFNCAVVFEGVKCWDQKGKAKLVEESAGAYKIAIGTAMACAITTHKGVICWKLYGENAYLLAKSYVPSGGIKEIKHVVAGNNSTCVYGDGEKLKCWGVNPYGSLTVPDTLAAPVSRIAHGSKRTCALRYSKLSCWGDKDKEYDIPENIGNVSYVSVGANHICAANPERARCWGEYEGEVYDVPRKVTNISKLASGNFHACAEANNEVVCWGGKGLISGVNPSEKIVYPRAICAGGTFSCAINIEGGVQCWGTKEIPVETPGDDGNPPPSFLPAQKWGQNFGPGSVRNATEIGCGVAHACAIYENKLKCWDTDGSTLRTPEIANPRKLTVGANHSCVLSDTGLKCWGGMLNMDMADYSLTK